jgi:hypothetical protein
VLIWWSWYFCHFISFLSFCWLFQPILHDTCYVTEPKPHHSLICWQILLGTKTYRFKFYKDETEGLPGLKPKFANFTGTKEKQFEE